MRDNQKIVYPYLGTCVRCGCYNDKDGNITPTYHRIAVGAYNVTFCPKCFEDLHAEMSLILQKLPAIGDTVWELRQYDDGHWWNWGIFPMTVEAVSQYGTLRNAVNEEPLVWNIYAVGKHNDTHKSFHDVGKTLFYTEKDAQAALERKNEEERAKPLLPEGHPDATW